MKSVSSRVRDEQDALDKQARARQVESGTGARAGWAIAVWRMMAGHWTRHHSGEQTTDPWSGTRAERRRFNRTGRK